MRSTLGSRSWSRLRWALVLGLSTAAACESDPPDEGIPQAGSGGAGGSGALFDPPGCEASGYPRPARECEPLASDYRPGADDAWPACVSDGGNYVPIEPTISTIARVRAFDAIRDLLFDSARDPSPADFVQARTLYQEDEGLDSRVARRYDPHVSVPQGTDCTVDGVAESHPDYCVGPARLQPILLQAFAAGMQGTGDGPPRVHAARIEAALLWFMYSSTYKESLTCTTTAKDCDSAYAYYAGGAQPPEGEGLADYVRAVDPEAHARTWDGILAVRCWRDLDAGETAVDLELRERARDQYDRAVLHGLASIVRDRWTRLCTSEGEALAYHWAFLTTLGPALMHGLEARSPDAAQAFENELMRSTPADADVGAAIAALDAVFQCP